MGKIGFADLSMTTTDQKFKLGSIYEHQDAVYMYVQANGAIDQYDLVTLDADFQAVAGTTTTSGARPTGCGLAQLAFADNEYGWVAIGPFPESAGIRVNALANCAADVKLYTSATAGHVDDTAADLVAGLTLSAAVGGSAASALCSAVQRLVTNCQD